MTWTAKEVAFTATTTQRFVDDDHAEWSIVVKDIAGKVLFLMNGQNVRVKEAKP